MPWVDAALIAYCLLTVSTRLSPLQGESEGAFVRAEGPVTCIA